MKTSILMTFSLLMITISLMGQTKSPKYQSDGINPGYPDSDSSLNDRKINNHIDINNKPELSSDKNTTLNFDLNQNDFVQVPSKYGFSSKNLILESWPNTSEYNFNMPCKKPGTGGKILIKKPDTATKYYLIIKGAAHVRTSKY